MTRRELETLLLTLESTPVLLARAAASVTAAFARSRPSAGGFSFVENVWHLADLEREGYALRLRRLLDENEPTLGNFDGNRIARERGYQDRDLQLGIDAFLSARSLNVAVLRALSTQDWKRRGVQEGRGPLSVEEVPRMMAEHDRSHTDEIALLLEEIAGRPGCEVESSPGLSACA